MLGGLLSAHDLTGGQGADAIYLLKARELGDKLLPAFNSPHGLPHSQIDLRTGNVGDYSWTGGSILLAEVGTCQMEFATLSDRTGDPRYAAAAQRSIDLLDKLHPPQGLYPIYLDPTTGNFAPSKVTLGAMGDSFYEYLLKMWLLTGKKSTQLQRMYRASMDGVLNVLLQRSSESLGGHVFLGDRNENGHTIDRKMDHLVCFVPGMLALGVAEGIVPRESAEAERHLQAAKDIMRTCYDSYALSPSGIGPEVLLFPSSSGMTAGEPSYKLRPEMLESLFLLWRLTGEETYREQAWTAWGAIDKQCRVAEGGYAALLDVRRPPTSSLASASGREDKSESFFLAETLKYLYLTFSDSSVLTLSGNRATGEYFVLNTECHPLRSWG